MCNNLNCNNLKLEDPQKSWLWLLKFTSNDEDEILQQHVRKIKYDYKNNLIVTFEEVESGKIYKLLKNNFKGSDLHLNFYNLKGEPVNSFKFQIEKFQISPLVLNYIDNKILTIKVKFKVRKLN